MKKEEVLLIRISSEDKEKLKRLSKSTGKSQATIVIGQIRHYYDNLKKKNLLAETEEQLIAKNEIAVANGFDSWHQMQELLNLNWLEGDSNA